ncbi:ankyrin repeat and SOCS box protein 15-like [Salmo salar]|uniref:Ankyrin repeat and SOCS box protein 15-like n=2 Tax=Salmo TaxID=8028 RepID=A0A1S3KNE9_SALSA|nr:ankyrin repeat and SOCS box protein 15-like [Salmo salar]|eukprot:XP_013980246.1 PREDICTED: ankyrin repeat and SOCS box protein 15-like [Salmo salar]
MPQILLSSLESDEHLKILKAIDRGDILALQELSEFQEGFSEADDRGWYPLHKAAVQPLVKMLEIVLCASFRLSL